MNKNPISLVFVGAVLRVVDSIVFFISAIAIHLLYLSGDPSSPIEKYIGPILVIILIQQNVFHFLNVYRSNNLISFWTQLRTVFTAWVAVFVVLLFMAFVTKSTSEYSRIWSIFSFILAGGLFAISRIVLSLRLRNWIDKGRLSRNVVIVGGGSEGRELIEFIRDRSGYVQLLGFFDDRSDRVPNEINGVPNLGNVGALLDYARMQRVDIILVALPWDAEFRILSLVNQLKELPVDIRLSPQNTGRHLAHGGYSDFAGVPMLNLLERPLNEWQMFAKEAEDRLLASLLLVLAAPLMLLIAIAIRVESRGPALFCQKRYGFNNRLIDVYKFRSMYTEDTDHNAEKLATANDPRITRVGKFLRQTSLDELPQLINVLKGDMSFVGPRPHAVAAKAADKLYPEVLEEYASRHRIKPGITGWAQVNGWRGNTDTEIKLRKRVEYDLYYIENWSLWFDLKIILLTFIEVLRRRNAY